MNLPTFGALKRNLKASDKSFPTYKIAVLGDSATQLFTKALKGYGHEMKVNFEIYEADYNQIDLQVFDPESELYKFQPEFVVIFKSSSKLLLNYYKKKTAERSNFARHTLSQIEGYIDTINQHLSTRILVCNFPETRDMVFGNYGNKTEQSWIFQVRKLNFQFMEVAMSRENVFINDILALFNEMGISQSFDNKTYINTDIVTSLEILPAIAKNTTDIVLSIAGKFKKCLILDLDNTTWGGIIGDDGMEGIQVGSLGIGKAFTELQLWAKNLKDRGIILGICSKNTESVAKVPFEKHPDMVLRLEDISIFVANWENKADNIRYIQQVLNIGFDSMVFVDDNPFERNLVRTELPQVTVPELPEDPAEYLSYLRQLNLFETASYSSEDSKRTEKYRQEASRVQLQQTYGSIEDYLKSLEMTGEFSGFDEFHLPRIAQLTQRSNQFNLRTVRYDEQQIRQIISSENKLGYYVKLADKFGEYGLISVLILDKKEAGLFIDTWIMSCRVLKRDVEKFVLNQLVEVAREMGYDQIIGEYLPTPKNALVKNHYADLGFQQVNNEWILSIDNYGKKSHYIDS